jgi:hypothetical protein
MKIENNNKNVSAIEIINNQLIYTPEIGQIGIKNLETGKENILDLGSDFVTNNFAYNKKTNTLFIAGDIHSFFWDMNSGDIFKTYFVGGAKDMNTVNNNSILVTYYGGANLLDFSNYQTKLRRNKKLEDFHLTNKTIQPKKTTVISTVRGYVNFYKEDSTMYVGQVDKLYHIDKNLSKTEIKYKGNSIFTTSITETKDGIVWVATNDNGVLGIKEQKVIYNYNIKNGLISNLALKVVADGNNFWAVTNKGLHFFDRELESFKSFSFQNEIPVQKVSDIKVYKNKLYLSGNSGIFVVDKDHFKQKIRAPKVYFESILVAHIH